MILGIQMKPGKGQGEPSVFYCGVDGVAFRKAHAELVAKNTDGSRFYVITQPLLVPLQNVEHSTEEHPDVIAAQKRRAELAAATEKPAEETTLDPRPSTLGEAGGDLSTLNKAGLLFRVEQFNASAPEGKRIVLDGKATKAQITAALLAAFESL